MAGKDPGCIPNDGTAVDKQKNGLAPKVTETQPPAKESSTGKFNGAERRQSDPDAKT